MNRSAGALSWAPCKPAGCKHVSWILYAMILARRGAYRPAVEHLQNYLHLSPNAADAHTASERLQELQHLMGSGTRALR